MTFNELPRRSLRGAVGGEANCWLLNITNKLDPSLMSLHPMGVVMEADAAAAATMKL